MKTIIIILGVVILAAGGYLLGKYLVSSDVSNTNLKTEANQEEEVDLNNTERDLSNTLRGRVMNVSDTELVIGTFAQREKGNFNREEMQNMSEEERQAFRDKMREEREAEGEPEIKGEKVIMLTDETEYLKGRSRFSGQNFRAKNTEDKVDQNELPTPAEPEKSQKSDIQEGMTVSVELKEGTLEAKKLIIQDE